MFSSILDYLSTLFGCIMRSKTANKDQHKNTLYCYKNFLSVKMSFTLFLLIETPGSDFIR